MMVERVWIAAVLRGKRVFEVRQMVLEGQTNFVKFVQARNETRRRLRAGKVVSEKTCQTKLRCARQQRSDGGFLHQDSKSAAWDFDLFSDPQRRTCKQGGKEEALPVLGSGSGGARQHFVKLEASDDGAMWARCCDGRNLDVADQVCQ